MQILRNRTKSHHGHPSNTEGNHSSSNNIKNISIFALAVALTVPCFHAAAETPALRIGALQAPVSFHLTVQGEPTFAIETFADLDRELKVENTTTVVWAVKEPAGNFGNSTPQIEGASGTTVSETAKRAPLAYSIRQKPVGWIVKFKVTPIDAGYQVCVDLDVNSLIQNQPDLYTEPKTVALKLRAAGPVKPGEQTKLSVTSIYSQNVRAIPPVITVTVSPAVAKPSSN